MDAWVAPGGGPVEQSAVSGASAPVAPATDARPSPLALAPMTVVDLLDGAIRVVKSAPLTCTVLCLVWVLPAQFVSGWLSRSAYGDVGFAESFEQSFDTTDQSASADFGVVFGGGIAATLVLSAALAGVCAGLAPLVAAWYQGRDLTPTEALLASLRRAPAVLLAWAFVHVVEGVFSLALFLPVLVPMTWYAAVTPVVAIERAGPWRSLGRSYRLCKARFGAVLGIVVLVGLVDGMLSSALQALASVFIVFSWGWIPAAAVASAASIVTVSFVAAAAVLLYVDLRVRLEGLDLAVALEREFARP